MACVLRRLLTPRWLGAVALAVLWAFATYHLGHWQYGRHLEKVERNARLDAHYHAAPVPLTSVMTSERLPKSVEWTRVSARGEYARDAQQYVRNRPNDGVYGYEVVVPLRLQTGESVLVDRGWVANSDQGARVLPPVPSAPSGPVEVVGWVRQGERSLGRDLPVGQLASLSVADASRAVGTPLLGGYVILDSEHTGGPGSPARPQPLAPPDRDLGPNQAYAYQWWGSMPLGLVLVYFGVRRELRAEGDQVASGSDPAGAAPGGGPHDPEDTDDAPDAPSTPGTPGTGQAPASRPSRRRRRSRFDDDAAAEDAEADSLR